MSADPATRLSLVQGDITKIRVDAIVNAANTRLAGGGGVDGAIHRAAGPELLKACRELGGCETGQAKITPGYRLPATWVIHVVGPVWQGGRHGEKELLAQCYQNALALAEKCFIRTIAFPSISTGAYQFPLELAAEIALREILYFLKENISVDKIAVVCFDAETYRVYESLLGPR